MTLVAFDQSDDQTWPDQQKDTDKENYKDMESGNLQTRFFKHLYFTLPEKLECFLPFSNKQS